MYDVRPLTAVFPKFSGLQTLRQTKVAVVLPSPRRRFPVIGRCRVPRPSARLDVRGSTAAFVDGGHSSRRPDEGGFHDGSAPVLWGIAEKGEMSKLHTVQWYCWCCTYHPFSSRARAIPLVHLDARPDTTAPKRSPRVHVTPHPLVVLNDMALSAGVDDSAVAKRMYCERKPQPRETGDEVVGTAFVIRLFYEGKGSLLESQGSIDRALSPSKAEPGHPLTPPGPNDGLLAGSFTRR